MLEIEMVEIIGLNHKCNVKFDFKKDCTILIGENGVGKTSAMKLLDFLLSGMITSVASYAFDSIRIRDNENTYEFSKDDFLVPVDVVINKFCAECLDEYIEEEKIFLEDQFSAMFLEMKNKDLLGKLLNELYYSEALTPVINGIVEKYIDPKLFKHLALEIDDDNPCYVESQIYKSKFYKNIVENEYWDLKVVFGHMIDKIKFPITDKSFVHFRYACEDEDVKEIDLVREDELLHVIENFEEYEVEMFYNDTNSKLGTRVRWEIYDLEMFQRTTLATLYRINRTENVFDIHSAIRAQYFQNYIINEVNEIAIEGVRSYWEYLKNTNKLNIEEVKDLINIVDKKVIYVHENYICPILAEELPYRINFARLVKQIEWYIEHKPEKINVFFREVCLLRSYIEIYEKLLRYVLYTENVSDSIRAFQDLVSQYIEDKKICITPKGLRVYLKEEENVAYRFRLEESWLIESWCFEESEMPIEEIVFPDVDTEISLNGLSSGECKIIMLAFYATFAEQNILIMDEPELSISILWQQKLIRDLLDYGQFKSIVVSTHSPYIARDNSLTEYIEYLP